MPQESQKAQQGMRENGDMRVGSWTGFKGKTLWDFLGLFIVPLSLALVALWFNYSQSSLDRQIADERILEDRSIAEDRRREETLQSYLGRMDT